MTRRIFLEQLAGLAASSMVGGCAARHAPATRPETRSPIRAICFDLFTLFDPRSVEREAERIVGEVAPTLCETWRTRQFEYAWLRASAGQYVDFARVTHDALVYACEARHVTLSAGARDSLVAAYTELDPWPDTREALTRLADRSIALAPLANYSPSMMEALLSHSGLAECFDAQISTDACRTFKPDPRAYALGESVFGLSRAQIAFCAFGGWDAAGARWFGYPTCWINRLGVTPEALSPGPDASGDDLGALEAFVDEWA